MNNTKNNSATAELLVHYQIKSNEVCYQTAKVH